MAPKKCSPAGIAAKAAGRKPKLSVAKAVPKPAAVKAKAKTKAKAKAFAPAPPPQDERLEANVKRQKTSHDGNDSAALPNDRKGSGGPLISDFMIMIPKQEPQEDSFAGDVICKEEGPPSPVGTVTLDSFVNGFQSEGDWKTKLQESWKSLDDGDLASLMQQAVECPMLKEYKILQDTKPNNPVDDFKLFVHWLVQKKVSSRITASAAASMSDKPVSPEHRGGLPDDTAEQQAPTAAATTQELHSTSSTALEETAETAAAPMADQRVSGSPDDPAKQQAPTEAAETQEGLHSTFSTVLQETEETAAATTAATASMSDQPVSPEHRGGLPDDTAKQQAPTADATQEELHSTSSTALQETAETAAAPMAHQPVSASPKHGYTSPDDPAKQQAPTEAAETQEGLHSTFSTFLQETEETAAAATTAAAASMSDKPVSPEHRGGLPDDTAEQQAPTAAATTQELHNTSSTALEEAAETAAAPMADQRVSGSPDDPAKQQAPTEAAETQEGLRSTFSTVLQETEETAAATTAATASMSDQPVSPEHRGGLPDDTAKQQAPTAADATQEELHSASSTALQETAETAAAPMAHQPVSASPKHGYTSPDDPAKQQAATHPAATLDKMGNTRSTAPLETANKHKATSISAASAKTDVEFVEVFLEDEAKCVAAVKQHHLFPAYLKFCQKHKPFIHFDWTHPGDGKQVDTVRNIRHFNSYLKNAEAPLLDISKLLRQYEAAMFDYDSTDDYVFPDLLLRVRSHPMFNEFIEDVYTNIEEPRYIQSGWTFGSWPHNDFKKFNTFLIQKGQPPIDLAEAWPAILAGWHYGLSTAELDLLSEEDFISALSAAQGHPLFREFWSSQLLEKPHQPRFASSSAHQVSNLESFVIYLRDTVKAYMKAGVAGEEHFNKYFGKMAPEETAGEGKQEQVEVEESKQAAMEWWSNCDPEFIANSLMNDENCPYCLEDEISRVKKFEHFAEYFHFLKKEEFVDDDYSYGDPEGDPVEDLVHFLRWFQKSPHSKINTETVTKRLDQKEAACASSLACNMMLFQTH